MSISTSSEPRVTLSVIDGGAGAEPRAYVPFSQYPDMLNSKQTAEALGVCEKTVRGLVRDGELFAVRVGRVWRVPKSALIAFSEGRPADGGD